jgi:peroxiredoxin
MSHDPRAEALQLHPHAALSRGALGSALLSWLAPWLLLLLAQAAPLGCAALASGHRPEPGEEAPPLTLEATSGAKVSLADYRGRQAVVLAFFPKAFTGGCTKEMAGLRDALQKLDAPDAQVLGVSTDDLPTQKKFAESLQLPFPLLADPDGVAAKAYGVYTAGVGLAARTTFVIGPEGRVLKVVTGSDAIDPAPALAACPRKQAAK